MTKTKVIKCKNPECELSFIIGAEIEPCEEGINGFKVNYTFVGAKRVHGRFILCQCGHTTNYGHFASAFERKAKKEWVQP